MLKAEAAAAAAAQLREETERQEAEQTQQGADMEMHEEEFIELRYVDEILIAMMRL